MSKRPTFVCSFDVKSLCTLLSEASVGQLISYKELSAAINKDIQTEGRGALVSARRIVQRELNIVFGTIAREGLKRLSDIEIVMTGDQTVTHIRRSARRGADRIAVAVPEHLPIEKRVRQNTLISLFGLMHTLGQENRIRRLEERVAQAESRLPLERTLDAFKDQNTNHVKEKPPK